MALDFEASPEDLKVFLDEAEEQLQLMEEDFVRLEKQGDNAELLQEIFRAAHTLKGSSATLGHRKMAEVTHHMENVLDKLRKGRLTVTTALVDTLFACLDVLKACRDEIASGEAAEVQTGAIIARLAAIDGSPGPARQAAAAVMTPPAPARFSGDAPAGTAAPGAGAGVAPATAGGPAAAGPGAPAGATGHPGLTLEQAAALAAARSAGATVYIVRCELDPTSPMPSVRAFQALLALGDAGRIIASWPSQQAIEADEVQGSLQVLVASSRPMAQLAAALESVPELSTTGLAPLDGATSPTAATPGEPEEEPGPAIAEAAEARQGRKQGGRTVRVDVGLLDALMNLVGELVIDRTRLAQFVTHLESDQEESELAQELGRTASHIGRTTTELQEAIMRARMLPVESLFKKFPRLVRDTAQRLGKEIDFVVRGENTELDRSVIEEIGDPLMHMLRNAVDHGIEPPLERLKAGKPARGTVTLDASHEENHIIIRVADDGRGIDPEKMRQAAVKKGLMNADAARRLSDQEAVNLVFAPGFSTAEKVSDLSGRGVGMDVVHQNIEKLNGAVEISTTPGQGTDIRVKLPLTLAIIRALLVEVRGVTYAVPLASVSETLRLPAKQVERVRGKEVVVYRGNVVLPLLRLDRVFGLSGAGAESKDLFVVIANLFGKMIGIVVDRLVGEQEVVIKSLGKYIGEVPGLSGATILGDGSVAIILDVTSLINSVVQQAAGA